MLLLDLADELLTGSLPPGLLTAWLPEPLPAAALVILGSLYAIGRRRLSQLSHHLRPGELGRRRYFIGGFLALAAALASPLHPLGEELFFLHMVQHVLLVSVAAPLLLLANPMPVILWALSPPLRARLGRALSGSSSAIRVLRFLTQPLVAWWVFALNLWAWHVPVAYEAALEHEPLHYLQHLLFFLTAVLFWWPVIGPAPLRSRLSYPARMLYVFVAWLPNSLLGALITFAPLVLVPHYAARPRLWGIDVMTDQQLAGLLMWIPGDLIYATTMIILLLAILREEDRREARTAAAL